ncbi:hypothetical protein GL263_06015 [Streptomyces durbertensis]|uniref:Uncharacterized protein n=1 Tax=Streptomyces durbertensis TaxID=2448886 RepID=A0ABR6ECS5_9ACTN|nr:hypothetical protein [Streptomyces durbertensis]MBB1243124.1 hypothetical protein [Streptomyces durbertensis]
MLSRRLLVARSGWPAGSRPDHTGPLDGDASRLVRPYVPAEPPPAPRWVSLSGTRRGPWALARGAAR